MLKTCIMTDEEKKEYTWNRAQIVEGYDRDTVRKDACGAWILKDHYGMRDSIFGWEVDHVFPIALGGDDFVQNLRAMQWENNVSKGDDYPSYMSAIQSEGNKNIRKEEGYTINDSLQLELRKHYNM